MSAKWRPRREFVEQGAPRSPRDGTFKRRKSIVFVNSKNTPLFEFIFCVGNPAGIRLAKKISRDILQKRAKP